MMYEAYEKKVRGYVRHARIFKICVKYAIIALIVGVVLLLGYLSLRGIHSGPFTLEDSLVAFGDKPDYDVFVLFGTYECEYALPGGGEWTTEQPVNAGTYRVRAVITKGFLGEKIYSEESMITLYRRDVILVPKNKFGASVPYGEQPVFGKHWEISDSVLAKGHYVDQAELEYFAFDADGGIIAYLNTASVVIRDRKGNDVTQGYNIGRRQGTLKVKQKQITVVISEELNGKKPVNMTKVYDGQSLYTTKYFITSGGLVSGDSLHITAASSPTDAGRHDNKVNVQVYSAQGQSRTGYYNIKVQTCKVIIEKRPLTVTTPDVTVEYSGDALYTDRYSIKGGSLAAGQGASLVFDKSVAVYDVTKRPVENKVKLKITDGGRDVTSNYDISYEFGNLTVTPRTLHVRTTDSYGLTYNGKAQSWTAYEIVSGSLGNNHYLEPVQAASLVEPGSCENRVEYKVLSRDGSNVTKNYKLSVSYGTLVVSTGGASVSIGLKTLSKTYDAKPLDPDDYKVSDICSIVSGSLCGKDYIEIVSTTGSQTDAGSSQYSVEYRIMHKNAKGEVMNATSWYNCSAASTGTLTVNKRQVTVKFDPITKRYDGNPAVPAEPDISDRTLASLEGKGHKIVLAPGAMQALVFVKDGINLSSAVSIGTYTYTIPKEYISVVLDNDTGADRTENYEILYAGNTVRIEGLSLTLNAPSASKQYDGTPLTADRFSHSQVRVEGDIAGYDVSFDLTGSQTDAGTAAVKCENIRVTDVLGRDVTENFMVTVKQGRLTVTPIPITVQSSSGSKEYDGLPLENATQMTLVSGDLIPGHMLGGSVNPNYITDVGTHKNDRVTPKVYSATGQDVSRNYDVTLNPGQYTVTQTDLHIDSPLVEGEYTGQPYTGTCDATRYAQGLALGQKVEIEVVSSGIELGRHSMKTVGCRVRNAKGEDVTGNYRITYTDGEVEIVPRRIVITTGSSTVSYEDAPAVNKKITVGGSGLIDGHSVKALFEYPNGNREIGSVTNALKDVVIMNSYNKDVTAYYEISFNFGTLRVKPIEITVKTDSAFKETYDGQPLAAPFYTVSKGELLYGHQVYAEFLYDAGVCDVGKWKNELSQVVVRDIRGNDVSHMYHITVKPGVLEIANPYPLPMASQSAEKMYDGTPLNNPSYVILGELLDGHTVIGVNPVNRTEVGVSVNKLTLNIVDREGKDVSKNYDFTYTDESAGTLLVTKRPLSVTVGAVEIPYNGACKLIVPQEQLIEQGLVAGQRLSQLVEVPSPEVGEKPSAALLGLTVYDALGKDVTHCYEIEQNGEGLHVTVVPAELLLYLPDRYSKEYDGKGLTVQDAGLRITGVAIGHKLVYEATEASAAPGSYTLRFLNYTVYDQNGEDVTANYTVDARSCIVTVHKKYIRLTSEDASRHYNGQPLICEKLKNYSLPGYRLEVVFTGSQTEVGESDNTFEVKVFDANDKDVTAFCNIYYTYGKLIVWDQVELVLQSGSKTGIYNGQALICHELSDYKLPEGYFLEAVFTGMQEGPGESENTFDVTVYDAGGQDVTSSFVITKQYGTLKVLEKPEDWIVTLYSKSATKQYDGQPLTCFELEPYELPEGFALVDLVFTGAQTEIGSSLNTFTARACNEFGDELTVICEYGTLEVALDITVTPYEKTFTYDGTEKNYGPEDFWTIGLPEDFKVEVTFEQEGLTYPGSKDVVITDVKIYDHNGKNVTDLCNLTIKTARLSVLPRKLTVYVYGQSADSIAPVQGSLLEEHIMFAEYGENGECYIEIADKSSGTLVYSNRGDSPIKHVLYDVNIQYA